MNLLILFNILALVSAFAITYICILPSEHISSSIDPLIIFPIILSLCTTYVGLVLHQECPEVIETDTDSEEPNYRVPLMPFVPLFGIFVNFFLVAQLTWFGLVMIVSYMSCAVCFYFLYGVHYSIGNNNGWADLLDQSSHSSSSAGTVLSLGRHQCICAVCFNIKYVCVYVYVWADITYIYCIRVRI